MNKTEFVNAFTNFLEFHHGRPSQRMRNILLRRTLINEIEDDSEYEYLQQFTLNLIYCKMSAVMSQNAIAAAAA